MGWCLAEPHRRRANLFTLAAAVETAQLAVAEEDEEEEMEEVEGNSEVVWVKIAPCHRRRHPAPDLEGSGEDNRL